VERSEGKKDQ